MGREVFATCISLCTSVAAVIPLRIVRLKMTQQRNEWQSIQSGFRANFMNIDSW